MWTTVFSLFRRFVKNALILLFFCSHLGENDMPVLFDHDFDAINSSIREMCVWRDKKRTMKEDEKEAEQDRFIAYMPHPHTVI